MASSAQISANRRNSAQSTGPRTPEGKAASAQNARTHGLYSQYICLPGEDQSQFDLLRQDLLIRYEPVGVLEEALIERILLNLWKIKRSLQIEADLFQSLEHTPACNFTLQEKLSVQQHLQALFQRQMDKASRELRLTQKERKADENQASKQIQLITTMLRRAGGMFGSGGNEANPQPSVRQDERSPEQQDEMEQDEAMEQEEQEQEIEQTKPIVPVAASPIRGNEANSALPAAEAGWEREMLRQLSHWDQHPGR